MELKFKTGELKSQFFIVNCAPTLSDFSPSLSKRVSVQLPLFFFPPKQLPAATGETAYSLWYLEHGTVASQISGILVLYRVPESSLGLQGHPGNICAWNPKIYCNNFRCCEVKKASLQGSLGVKYCWGRWEAFRSSHVPDDLISRKTGFRLDLDQQENGCSILWKHSYWPAPFHLEIAGGHSFPSLTAAIYFLFFDVFLLQQATGFSQLSVNVLLYYSLA